LGPATPLEQTLATYGDLVRSGKIRSVGLSNFTGWQLQRAILLARFGHRPPIATLQPQYSLVARELEWELLPLCIDEGVGLLAWSPFGGGWLTGKYRREGHPTGATRLGEDPERGVEAWDQRGTERTWRTVDAVRDIAEESGKSMAQVALRWVMDRPAVSATIWAYAALSSSTTTSVPPAGT
jgi:aryl-alcohol dehydrogenase-like predicted oxidoreductase